MSALANLRGAIESHRYKWITDDQFARACAAWAADESTAMPEWLHRMGWIDEGRREALELLAVAPPPRRPQPVSPPPTPLSELDATRADGTATLADDPLGTFAGGTLAEVARGHSAGAEATLADEPEGTFVDGTLADPPSTLALGPDATLADDPRSTFATGAGAATLADRSAGSDATLADDPDATVAEPMGDSRGFAYGNVPGPDSPTMSVAAPGGHVLLTSFSVPGNPDDTRDRYTLTRLHAMGGIGQVWLARDPALGREVALKELRPEQAHNESAWARFLEEARITGQLEHPGIVPVYELTRRSEMDLPFYTMRFLKGGTLRDAIVAYHAKRDKGEATALDRAALLNAFVAACNAIGYAHSRGVIHRDLKGQNIVLGDFGEVVVLDWGLAKVLGEPATADSTLPTLNLGEELPGHNPTLEGQVQGTPAYMAPEQAEGRIDAIDGRTDVYGLGAILYEILTGRPPFTGNTTAELLRQIREATPPKPRSFDPSLSPALEAVCLKALSRQPDDRYPSATALALEVRRWLADEPVDAYPEPWTTRLNRWGRRHRQAVAAAAALLVLSTIVLSTSSVLVRRERDEARRQREQARHAVDDMYSQVADKWLEDRLDPVQKDFLGKALAYYEGFTQQDAHDPIILQERGRAFLRMGDVLRKLGRGDEAESAYRKALGILAPLASTPTPPAGAREALGLSRTHLAALLVPLGRRSEAETLYQEAIATADPTDSATRLAAAGAERGLGELLRIEGRTRDAAEALGRAEKGLESAVAAAPSEIEPRRELAVALDLHGQLDREASRFDQAGTAFRRAAELLESVHRAAPTLPRIREGLAKVYNSLGLLATEHPQGDQPEDLLRREVALLARVAEDFPDRPEVRRELARGRMNLGAILRASGHSREAGAEFRGALDLNRALAREFPAVVDYRRDQALCLNSLAVSEDERGRPAEAEPLYREGLGVYEGLVAAAPTVPRYRAGMAALLVNLGKLLDSTGRAESAEESYDRARGLLDDLTLLFPDDPDYRRSLAACLGNLGDSRAVASHRPQAEEAYGRAADAYEKLLALSPPGRSTDRKALATFLSNRGDNLTMAKLPGAESVLRRSFALYEALAAEAKPPATAETEGLAIASGNLGECLDLAGRPADAEVAYRRSLSAYEALTKADPTRGDWQSGLGETLADLASLRKAAGQNGEALALLDRAAVADRETAKLAPADDAAKLARHDHLIALATSRLDVGAHAEAARALREASEIAKSGTTDRLELARLWTRCVPLARNDAALANDRREGVAGSYADHAIALLREAIERGDVVADKVLSDDAFQPLRTRDAFGTLPLAMAANGSRGPG